MSTMPSGPDDSHCWPGNGPAEPKEIVGWDQASAKNPPPPLRRHGAGLIAMVESEIIPRLMLAHRNVAIEPTPAVDPARLLGRETTETFARMVVTREPASLIAFVGGLLQAGVALDTIYVELLVPAARRLGEYWDEDSASFTDVTVGLGRLQQVVRALGSRTAGQVEEAVFSRSAFFAPGPGEQHLFGLFIVEDFFRRAGWRTWVETNATAEELIDTTRSHWFDVFGMSLSVQAHADEVSDNIRAIREASRNPNIFVMVGGRLLDEHPELITPLGADATAASGGEALLVANHALLIANNQLSALTQGA